MTTINEFKSIMQNVMISAWGSRPIVLDNEADGTNGTAMAGTAWMRFSIEHADSSQITIGGVGFRKFRRAGAAVAQINAPPNAGTKMSDDLAQIVINAFEGVDIGANIYIGNVVVNEVGQVENWYRTTVTIFFEYDSIK